MRCFFVTDLHGRAERYRKLFEAASTQPPDALFMGGDLLPSFGALARSEDPGYPDFVNDFLAGEFESLRRSLGSDYPKVFLILGNDDPRAEEESLVRAGESGLWEYVHERRVDAGDISVYGYACVPPTPFLFKDWERYDVSRYVDPGAVSPEEGHRSVPVEAREVRHATILDDLHRLAGDDDLSRAVFLFHSPPYKTSLDRAALDGKRVDHVPLDVHVGSVAIQRFIRERQPLVTLHGHVHESARMTGEWRDMEGRTHMFSAAHDGPELALVRFDTEDLEAATRELL